MANNNLFPTIVGKARIRDYDNDWLFANIECATNVKTSISTSETKELVCWEWEWLTLEKPAGTITFKVIKTKNADLIWRLLDLIVTNKTGGETNVTDRKVTFDKNWFIELLDRSNDNNWFSNIVLKSIDGVTTYTKDTDYEVSVVENRTILKRKWTNIPEKVTVLFSWKINQNASKEAIIKRIQRGKKKFTIELFWEDQATKKMTTLLATPVTLNSEYLLEMIDAFRDWDIAGSELAFVLADWGSITFRDENI